MTYGLGQDLVNAVIAAKEVVTDKAYEIRHTDGTIERICEGVEEITINGEIFTKDPLIEGSELNFPKLELIFLDKKPSFYDDNNNFQSAAMITWFSLLQTDGSRMNFKVHEGTIVNDTVNEENKLYLEVMHKSALKGVVPPAYQLSELFQKNIDKTDTSMDAISDNIDVTFGRGVS